MLGGMMVGDPHPVRIMAVINLSQESFFKGSFAGTDDVLERAASLTREGADMLDLGAVSTAPGSPPITEEEERRRLIPALEMILREMDVEVSVDTQRSSIAKEALSMGVDCVNDVSGLVHPDMAEVVAEYDASLVIMASRNRPGDILSMSEIVQVLGERLKVAIAAGVSERRIIIDPGVGWWIPEKLPEYDLAILDGLDRLRVLNRPVLVAVSRKSFIGATLDIADPKDRLAGSLAATAISVYNGAHVVRTHDVSESIDVIRMSEAIRGRQAVYDTENVEVEVCISAGYPNDLKQIFERIEVGEGGSGAMGGKGAFRVLSVRKVTSMEAVIIKQEMLARGGDAAIPMGALRCDPGGMEVLVMGTDSQIRGLIRNLKRQPFNLPAVGKVIGEALEQLEGPDRYR
jgi:dihydropteroate synthase